MHCPIHFLWRHLKFGIVVATILRSRDETALGIRHKGKGMRWITPVIIWLESVQLRHELPWNLIVTIEAASLLFPLKLFCAYFSREVGTIIRSLGCYPSEAELDDMLKEVEEEEPTGFVRWEKFQPMMARVLLDKK